jgi:hypothetical protein
MIKQNVSVWKWTDSKNQTKNGTQWGEGVAHSAPGGGELCTGAYLHAYRDPLLAVAFRPIHVDGYSVLWQGTADAEKDDGTKLGCTRVTTEKIVEAPEIPLNALVRWGIYCAKTRDTEAWWLVWADKWLSGNDRSHGAAYSIAYAADAAKYAAYAADAAKCAANAANAKIDLLALLKQAIADEAEYERGKG